MVFGATYLGSNPSPGANGFFVVLQGGEIKNVLFIDGSNLFGGISELLKPSQYINFSALLSEIEKDFSVTNVYFYGTYMRIDPSKSAAYRLRVETQKVFFDSVKDCQKVSFYKGHFSGTGKEKGIDVKLAVDMAIGACTGDYHDRGCRSEIRCRNSSVVW